MSDLTAPERPAKPGCGRTGSRPVDEADGGGWDWRDGERREKGHKGAKDGGVGIHTGGVWKSPFRPPRGHSGGLCRNALPDHKLRTARSPGWVPYWPARSRRHDPAKVPQSVRKSSRIKGLGSFADIRRWGWHGTCYKTGVVLGPTGTEAGYTAFQSCPMGSNYRRVLAIGIQLPVDGIESDDDVAFVCVPSTGQAVHRMRHESFDLLVIRVGSGGGDVVGWLQRVRDAKPYLPIVVFVVPEGNEEGLERNLRRVGVTAVMNADDGCDEVAAFPQAAWLRHRLLRRTFWN